MKRHVTYFLVISVTVLVVVALFAALQGSNFTRPASGKKPFYLGVTYSGDSTSEAHALIDRVKNYTNVFVVTSFLTQTDFQKQLDIGDYAVDSGLDVIFSFSPFQWMNEAVVEFADTAQARWGSHFLGIYFGDEPGGKMLDDRVELGNITKEANGALTVWQRNDTRQTYIRYERSGEITAIINDNSRISTGESNSVTNTYYINGTIKSIIRDGITFKDLTYLPEGTVEDQKGNTVTDQGNISKFESRQELWEKHPVKTYNNADILFIQTHKNQIDAVKNKTQTNFFTSDYGLYWFDYKAGYDTVFAQLGPNENSQMELSLVRGAAYMQNKNWGAIITWTNSTTPSLPNGQEMHRELELAYRSGADYGLVFNYAHEGDGAGLLGEEHFEALEKFWVEVVENPNENNNVKPDFVLFLPNSYGWGMRNPNDTIWGLWLPDDKSEQVWNAVQNVLAQGNNVDIVYDDATFPVTGKYQHIQFWNSTG